MNLGALLRQVYFIIGIDEEHRPVHTTRICSDLEGVLELRDMMAEQYYDALICQETKLNSIKLL